MGGNEGWKSGGNNKIKTQGDMRVEWREDRIREEKKIACVEMNKIFGEPGNYLQIWQLT